MISIPQKITEKCYHDDNSYNGDANTATLKKSHKKHIDSK